MTTTDLRTITHVIDALGTDDPAVVDCALSATVAACRNRHPLLDFDEFPARGAL